MRIFISHSSREAEFANIVCKMLEEGGHSCFIAPRDIRPGKEYAEEIVDGITGADILLLLLSQDSNTSQHVFREVERAVSSHVPIIVYKMAEVELTKSLSYFLMVNQWIDGTKDKDLSRLLDAVNSQETGKNRAFRNDSKSKAGNRSGAKRLLGLTALTVCVTVLISGAVLLKYNQSKKETNTRQESSAAELVPGDKLEFGSYEGSPIEWRLLHLSENKELAILISEKILTMKCFDAAEGGTYNCYNGEDYWTKTPEADIAAYVRGSNLWANSNIRTWLNSEKNVVVYADTAPTASAMSEKKNGYHTEPGFLFGFKEEEKEILRECDIFTKGNILMDSLGIHTKDKVFLLSEEELAWLAEADINIFAAPTEAAVDADQTKWYEGCSRSLGVEEYIWILRDPADDSTSACRAVTNGYNGEKLMNVEAGAEGFGIRPAICVDFKELLELQSKK